MFSEFPIPPSPNSWQPPLYFVSLNLTALGILYKWNVTVFVLLWLISFSTMSSVFIHVVEYVRISFHFKMNNIPLYIHAIFCLSIYPISEHLGDFHLIAFVDNAAMNMSVYQYFLKTYLLVFWGIYLEVELLDHMVILFLII